MSSFNEKLTLNLDNLLKFEEKGESSGYSQFGNVAANVSCRGLEINLRETAHHPSCGVIVGVVMEEKKRVWVLFFFDCARQSDVRVNSFCCYAMI